jgi:hypothetical protein
MAAENPSTKSSPECGVAVQLRKWARQCRYQVARSTGGKKMSYIDVVIPAIIGLVALVWPKVMFAGSSVTADAKKIRLIRAVGVILLAAATIYLAVKLVGA